MPLVPHRFLFRITYPCKFIQEIPHEDGEQLLNLPVSCRIDDLAGMDQARHFAEIFLAWNDLGLGVQVQVRGKDQPLQGDAARPRSSDGLTLWIDTRDARTSHRASRYCHMFHLLPVGGGPDRDEPVFAQASINRALEDAPLCRASEVPFRCELNRGGYLLEAFLSAAVLNGFDPEQNPRLGFFYAVRDAERGDQLLGADPDLPYWEDPSLWSVLELQREP